MIQIAPLHLRKGRARVVSYVTLHAEGKVGQRPDHCALEVSAEAFMAKLFTVKRHIKVKCLNGAVREISALQPGRE
jgi:hypothetical protein